MSGKKRKRLKEYQKIIARQKKSQYNNGENNFNTYTNIIIFLIIANNTIRSVILQIQHDRCKIVKILVFRSKILFTLKMFSGKRTKY